MVEKISKIDMTNLVIRQATRMTSPSDRVNLIRRHWGELHPDHELNASLLSLLKMDIKSVPLEQTVFPFERFLVENLPTRVTVYGGMTVSRAETFAPEILNGQKHLQTLTYTMDEELAKTHWGADLSWLPQTRAIWKGEISTENIAFFRYNYVGGYNVVCFHEDVYVFPESIQSTTDGKVWTSWGGNA